jgi:peptide chain release factor 2
VELQSVSYGEEAGIKSAVYKISGHNAYGWLKSESACTGWCGSAL